MKIALCFYGLCDNVNFENNLIEFIKSFETIKSNIIQDNECDIYIDTITQIESTKEKLLELFKPKKYIIDNKIRNFFKDEDILKKYPKINIAYGRWLSQKNVISLKNEYEKEHNFNYDVTFLTRFDCSYFTKFNFNEYNLTKLHIGGWEINKQHDLDVYGIDDIWFFGDSTVINKLSLLFDNLLEIIDKINSISNHLLAYNYIKYANINYEIIKNHKFDYNITRRL